MIGDNRNYSSKNELSDIRSEIKFYQEGLVSYEKELDQTMGKIEDLKKDMNEGCEENIDTYITKVEEYKNQINGHKKILHKLKDRKDDIISKLRK